MFKVIMEMPFPVSALEKAFRDGSINGKNTWMWEIVTELIGFRPSHFLSSATASDLLSKNVRFRSCLIKAGQVAVSEFTVILRYVCNPPSGEPAEYEVSLEADSFLEKAFELEKTFDRIFLVRMDAWRSNETQQTGVVKDLPQGDADSDGGTER
ncbi:MAG: hypothetical protein WC261_11390 [Synergistaceae bacterium]